MTTFYDERIALCQQMVDYYTEAVKELTTTKQEFAEAMQNGNGYRLFIKGHHKYDYGADDFCPIIAESDERAIEAANSMVYMLSRSGLDGKLDVPVERAFDLNVTVNHPYRLYQNERLVHEYFK